MRYKHVLLVDDNGAIAEIFAMALKTIDQSVKCTIENNVLQALKNLNSAKKLPDIVFLDFYISHHDGHEFLKLLRGVKGLKKIPVVLYSGHTDSTITALTKSFQSLAFLEKPNNFKDIMESLQMILGYEQLIDK